MAHPVRALKALGLWEEMKAAGIPQADPYTPMRDWPPGVDCTLAAYPLSKTWADRVSARMKEAFLSKSACEWETVWGEARVPGRGIPQPFGEFPVGNLRGIGQRGGAWVRVFGQENLLDSG